MDSRVNISPKKEEEDGNCQKKNVEEKHEDGEQVSESK